MPIFKTNQQVNQPDPVVKVEVGTANPLPVGVNRFRLVVIDNDGNPSDPTFLDVIVQAPAIPTAVLDLVDANNRVIAPAEVPFGRTFVLSGARSKDVAPGTIAEYQFTLVDRP